MKQKIIASALSTILTMPAVGLAAADIVQQQLVRQAQDAKKKLAAAEAAKGAERRRLMSEHMKMMSETMEKMQAMKPRPDMTMQEQKEWIAEHQKLMDMMMDQMMGEHHLIMQTPCTP